MLAIPSQIQYAPSLPVLPPETVNTSVVISPSNGSSFTPTGNSQIIFDLNSANFIDPATLVFSCKIAVTNATTAQTMRGGGYSIISRLETLLGSQNCESISNYNVLYNDWVNLQYNFAQKASLANSHGILDNSTLPTFGNTNNRSIPIAGDTFSISIPLMCLISQCEKLFPAFSAPAVRIQLTLDTIANIFSGSTITQYTVTNPQISYDMISFGKGVENLVRAMGDKIYVKSQSFTMTGSSLSTASSGNISLIYNQRLSSIKGLLAHFAGTDSALAVNKSFDSTDITNANGLLQFMVSGIPYPARACDTLNLKSSAMSELRQFVAGYHDIQGSNMSILPVEWNYLGSSTTTATNPGKWFFAVNTEKIQGESKSLLSGISTQNSPISLNLQLNTATSSGFTVLLMCMYDVLIEIDTVMKQATVKQ